ncbi:MAG: pyridoxine 5'-phosphate synthase [Saprospiraceae bacterium]
MVTRLSVNINKIALIRNSRKGNYPDLIKFALDCERFGADGITVHPRPDQRHIRFADIGELKKVLKTELNIEGFPSPHFIDLVCTHKPTQVTLVPDSPEVLTSDQGWNIEKNRKLLKDCIDRFKREGIRVSLFLDPDVEMVQRARDVGSDCIELYTGPYSWNYTKNRFEHIKLHEAAALKGIELGMRIHAGHDLNLQNLAFYKLQIPRLDEVSIGHALITDAIYFGLENVLLMYKNCIK